MTQVQEELRELSFRASAASGAAAEERLNEMIQNCEANLHALQANRAKLLRH